MPGSSHPGRHNVRVTSRRPPRRPLLLVVLLAAALVVAGCGASTKKPAHPAAKPSVALPTGDVSVPPGVKITPPGTKLSFGQTATVAYEPNTQRKTVLQLTVTRVQQGRISDLAAYVLDRQARRSTPYYVHVKVRNAGTGDVGHTDVPVWLVDQDNTLIHASGFTNRFAACPSTSLPAKFGPGASEDACLLYLVPDHGHVTAMSFRPLQRYAPITWTGQVSQPKAHRPGKHKHGKKKH
jgi:hypothetical protein